MHKWFCSSMHITSGCVLDMFSDLHIPLTDVWYLVYSEYCTWYTTSDNEQIIAIFHLVLQVYCSPSLKEHLHNPVMPFLARSKERRASILHAHGGGCACVFGGCVWIYVWLCVHAHQCVHLCQCHQNSGYNLQVYVHVSVTTQVKAQNIWQLLISLIHVYSWQMRCYSYIRLYRAQK